MPAARNAADDPFFEDPDQAVFLEQMETAVFPPNIEAWVEIEDVLDRWVEKALFGMVTSDEALSGACKEINALLARPTR